MFRFLKSTLFTGLLILIPLVVLYIAIRELLQLLVGFATPIADLFPRGTFDHVRETEIIAVLLVLGSAFIIGLIAKVKMGSRIGKSIERNSLEKIPMYRMLKSLVGAFLDIESENSFKPALIAEPSGEMTPCYVIEDGGGSRVVVLIPKAPSAFSGFVKIIPRDAISYVPVSLDEFSLSITHFGLGMSDHLPDTRQSGDR